MKPGWEIKKLGEVAKAIYGYTEKASSDEIGPKFLRITDIQDDGVKWQTVPFCKINEDDLKKYKLSDGDIVFARTGATTGKSYLVSKPPIAVFASYLIKVHINYKGLLPEYLFLFFQTNTYWDSIAGGISGSAQGGFNASKLSELAIPIPPLPEQQRIVSILDEAFAAIAKAKANAEQNLRNAKELFESYLQGVFEEKGEGWEEVRFEDLCKLTRGHNPPKSKFISEPKEGYVRFYQIRDGWADDYAVYVPETPQLHRVGPDDILMVAYRHIGKVFRGVSGAFNVALCKITNKDRKKLNDDYLFHLIPTDVVKGELMKRSERSLIPSMSVEHLKEIKIPLPPLSEQQKIVQKLDALSAETKKLEAIYQQKINDLEEMKKSILQKAFSGELKTS